MPLTVTPLANVGVEISGFDIAAPLDDALAAELVALWDEHGILLFRGQKVTPQNQIAFSRLFGELEIHPIAETRSADYPELFTLVNGRECAGKSSAVVVERSASKYAIRRAEQFGDDFVVVATNDYISMDEFGTSAKQLASDIGASSCKRYNGVLDGIKAAREILEIPQGYPIPRDEIRAIMRDQEFGCTIHAALFDMDSDTVKWD